LGIGLGLSIGLSTELSIGLSIVLGIGLSTGLGSLHVSLLSEPRADREINGETEKLMCILIERQGVDKFLKIRSRENTT